jgi:hypothetical protein
MLHFRILVSAIPLLGLAIVAHGRLLPGPHPCIAAAGTSVQIADQPWRAHLHVGFTDDPTRATVRVLISDSSEAADFVMTDDVETSDAGACEATKATTLVAIAAQISGDMPVIYLTSDGPADYRIFVRSSSFSARDAAALIVGANDGRRLQAASL